jgi:thioesterase domain-containing protein
MAKEDFCFTYYDGDALRDMSHMNRLERGAYNDLVLQIRKFGRITLEQIKKILGKDFESCWDSIELVLKKDADGKFFIEWLEMSLKKMRAHAKIQSQNGKKKSEVKTEPEPIVSQSEANLIQKLNEIEPIEDGDGDEYEIDKKTNEFKKFSKEWFELIFDERHIEDVKMIFREHDVDNELKIFCLKVRGSPKDYDDHGTGGIRRAFIHQLKTSKATNGDRNNTKTSHRSTVTEDSGKTFGAWQ